MRVLVTGGTGVLGRQVVAKLKGQGYTVRVLSRNTRSFGSPEIEWVQADLETVEDLHEAVSDVHTIVHAASSPFKHAQTVDVRGTRVLLEHARRASVQHLVYISIVGVDRIPSYSYYRVKQATEEVVAQARLPWSVLRATQFYELLDYGLQLLTRLPIMPLPTDLPFQPVDSAEVADALCEIVTRGPAARLPDMGGPEILRVRDIARIWLRVRGLRRFILPLHLPGESARRFRQGYHTCPEQRQGRITWSEWIASEYSSKRLADDTRSSYAGRFFA